MSRYEREEYENWDEYEDEEQEEGRVGDDEYEEEEEEAPPQPTQQELEYLELRKQLKDVHRKQMKKENGASFAHSQEIKKKLPYKNYGSFFGPSQPVIAKRVLQESMSLLENERLTAKVLKPNHNNKSSASTSSNGGSQTNVHVSRPKVVNQLKNKVEKVKDARDYSFLLSDDAELPAPSKDSRNVSGGPSSDARSGQGPPKNKPILNSNGRQASNGSRQVQNGSRQASNGNRQVHSESRQVHSESRQASNGNRQVLNGSRQASNGNRQVSNGSRQLPNGREEKRYVSSAANANLRAAPQKLNSAIKPISKQVDSRKQILSNNGSGPGRPGASKPLPNKVPSGTLQNKVSLSGAKSNNSVRSMPKPSSAIKQPMISKQSSSMKQPLDQRKGCQDSSKGKILSKQPVPPSRHQMSKPLTKVPSRPTFEKDRPKKRPARPFSDDEDDLGGSSGVTSMIQKILGYNPYNYNGVDSDDSDMEAPFHEIMEEEKKSAQIAKMEDEEEARKLEEEEERLMLRKQAKKRKLTR